VNGLNEDRCKMEAEMPRKELVLFSKIYIMCLLILEMGEKALEQELSESPCTISHTQGKGRHPRRDM
jgi:hypothetical protein